MNIRIAICDDEQGELSYLQELVKKYNPDIDVSLFSSAESLMDGVKRQNYDITLLDIEMDGLDGFSAAKELVKIKNPPLVILVTNSGEYTVRGYEVAFRYLPKPVSYDVLANALSAAIDQIVPYKFTITANGRAHVIPINEILFFEASGHNLSGVMERGSENGYYCVSIRLNCPSE